MLTYQAEVARKFVIETIDNLEQVFWPKYLKTVQQKHNEMSRENSTKVELSARFMI
jgi:hypothetical protein